MRCLPLLLLVAGLPAAPREYIVHKTLQPKVVDGDLKDWAEGYFIDTLRSDSNVFARDGGPWTPADFNGRLYMAWDDSSVFFALIISSDDRYCPGNPYYLNDHLKVNPGGVSRSCYVSTAGAVFFGSASPFNTSLRAAVDSTGGPGGLPVYEWSIGRRDLDPPDSGAFKLCVGSEENDLCGGTADQTVLGWGVEFTGSKNSTGPQRDSAQYYPTFRLSSLSVSPSSDTTPPSVYYSSGPDTISPTWVSLRWTTGDAASSRVIFGTGGNYTLAAAPPGFSTLHRVLLQDLTPATAYTYKVISTDPFGNADTGAAQAFTTTVDTNAPAIANVAARNVTPTGAEIYWTTDERATSTVYYGRSGQFNQSVSDMTLTRVHSVVLSALSDNSQYDFRVASADTFGLSDSSAPYTFKTPSAVPGAYHVFWYMGNLYDLEANPGPAIPSGAVLHTGMVATGSIYQASGSQGAINFNIGSGLDDAQGRCGFVWSRDLCNFQKGTAIRSAFFRGEFRDGGAGSLSCNAGPITIRCGVADFSENIAFWGSPDLVSDSAYWQDFLNPFGSAMGFDINTRTLGAEEIIQFTAPAGKPGYNEPSVLDSQFLEIDITDQVNWILDPAHTGQYAVVFLVDIGKGSTGKVLVYASENRPNIWIGGSYNSDNPWTTDGNTAHILMELAAVGSEARPGRAGGLSPLTISPNPFRSTARISVAGSRGAGIVSIFSAEGRKVFSRKINGDQNVHWSAKGMAAGVYTVRLTTAGGRFSKKLLFLK